MAGATEDMDSATTPLAGDDFLAALLDNPIAEHLIRSHVSSLSSSHTTDAANANANAIPASNPGHPAQDVLAVALAAFDAFLQANVTGPVLPPTSSARVEALFAEAWDASSSSSSPTADGGKSGTLHHLRRACLAYLEVDGVSPYAHIPRLELFSLARYTILDILAPAQTTDIVHVGPVKHSLAWTALRLNSWHYKIITQPSLGPGSNFNRSSQWIDVPTLATKILNGIDALRARILDTEVWAAEGKETWSPAERALFLIETASNYISLGRNDKAREAVADAVAATGFSYALSGALGKRTKFQERDISQLVVLAKSADAAQAAANQQQQQQEDDEEEDVAARPDDLKLNDDTLLEEISFAKAETKDAGDAALPPALAGLSPDDQPQLDVLDEMILLTEATLKDAFSPVDGLTAEQILPFAVRVITDKSVNWQVYTQALLVRSRIEIHRSRTVERGVLQLQAVADQVIADTTYSQSSPADGESNANNDENNENNNEEEESQVPVIRVSGEAAPVDDSKPTTFLPAPKQSESAPAHVRLRYIHALSSPPRWHLESELAYSWAGVGSMASALDIFKRLRLWAEVALCLASTAAARDDEGKGSGGENKARAVVRWRLFSRTGTSTTNAAAPSEPEDELLATEGARDPVSLLRADDWAGPERSPPPPDAPRLWCILGDLEEDPSHYERAWELSRHRYARAQRSIGEHHIQAKDWPRALEAYRLATRANRMSPDMWGRLGDISLRLGRFEDAAQAFSRSIGSASDTAGGEGARTWSNLGSALWSLYLERTAEKEEQQQPPAPAKPPPKSEAADDEEENEDQDQDGSNANGDVAQDPAKLLRQALAAYKKGASIAHDNWRIWDNVLTLATRVQPLPLQDMLLALTHIIRIRRSEDALDAGLLSALLQDVVLSKEKPTTTSATNSTSTTNTNTNANTSTQSSIYEPPRGSPERSVIRLLEEQIAPLITHRPDLWSLIARARSWKRDHAGAIDASERAWRAAVGSSGSSLLPGESSSASTSASGNGTSTSTSRDWTTDRAAWDDVVKRTDELVAMLENWGPDVESIGKRWRGKARSAVRSVMGRGREAWEGSEGWNVLEGIMEGLKA